MAKVPLFPRSGYAGLLRARLRASPAVVILGARQCGKSTLAQEFVAAAGSRGRGKRFDLEKPSDLARLQAAPEQDLGSLQRTPGLVCIDEVQRAPFLFPLLRVLLDDPRRRARYLLLGSASPSLVAGVSESLAGRVSFLDLTPFLEAEVQEAAPHLGPHLWVRGGFPRSFLARSGRMSFEWRESYIRTFLEQDVPALGLRLPAPTLRRLWTMLAHLHGGLLNASELAAGLGVSVPTVGRYLDVLEGTFMVRRLPPYWANIGKRLTKAPKVYLRDTGLLHALLGIEDLDTLRGHPKVGASWEGLLIEQIVGALALAGETVRPHFWRTHGGAEVDLLLEMRGRILPIEIKMSGEPRTTRGLLECMRDLGLRAGFVMHGGDDAYSLGKGVHALPASLVARPTALRNALRRPGRKAAEGSAVL
jgi:predicted AAA+ superfamily ATPase